HRGKSYDREEAKMLQQKKRNSLHSRVNDYLRGKPGTPTVDESEDTIEAILEQLIRAEHNLKTAQERVDRLRWELAKARSETSPDAPGLE
ncbi:MAG TPA: hypothetical protein VIV27_06140, partial [Halioglobus sp.]